MNQSRRKFLSELGALGVAILGGRADDPGKATSEETASDEWPLVNKDLENTSRNPDSRAPDHNLNTVMETDEDNFHPNSYTVMDGNRIYVGIPFQDTLKAFNRQTGNKEWETGVGGPVSRPISVGDEFVYEAASNQGKVKAIDKDTGEQVNSRDVLSAAGVHISDSGDVFVPQSTGNVAFFDEDLSNRRVYDDSDPEAINIARETLVEDDWGRTVYVERGDSSSANARILDPETAEVVDETSVGGDAEDGGAYVDDLFVYHERDDLVAYEVTETGFGDQAWSVNTGRDDKSPVVFDGFVFGGTNDGEVYRVDVESAEMEMIDEDGFDVKVDALVAGEHTLLVGDVMRNMRAYDLETGELVTDFDGFRNPDAVVSGNLVERVYNPDNGNFKLRISEGEYRDVDLEGPDAGYDVVRDSTVVGDGMVLEADVELGDGSVEGYEWSLEGGGLEESFSGGESWDITEVVSSVEDDVDEDYQEMLTATVEVTDENGKSDSHSESFPVEGLDADLSIDDRVDKGDGASASFDYDQDQVEAVDSIYVEVLDESGETVYEYIVDSLEYNFDIEFDGPGEYTVSVDYGLLNSYTEEIDVQVVGEGYVPPVVGDDSPTDPDDDGLYEDVDGGSQFNIFDVQAFFSNFQSEAVQEYAGRYNFDGDGDITIFDVQALFNEL